MKHVRTEQSTREGDETEENRTINNQRRERDETEKNRTVNNKRRKREMKHVRTE